MNENAPVSAFLKYLILIPPAFY